MLSVPGIDPKRIECKAYEDGTKRVRLDGRPIAYINEGGVQFDSLWNGRLNIDANAVLRVVAAEWLASDGTRLWPDPPPDLLEVAKVLLSGVLLFPEQRQLLIAAIEGEEAKRAVAKEAK